MTPRYKNSLIYKIDRLVAQLPDVDVYMTPFGHVTVVGEYSATYIGAYEFKDGRAARRYAHNEWYEPVRAIFKLESINATEI